MVLDKIENISVNNLEASLFEDFNLSERVIPPFFALAADSTPNSTPI